MEDGKTKSNHYRTQEEEDEATASPSKLSDQGFNDSDRLSARCKRDPPEQLNCNRELVGCSDDEAEQEKVLGYSTQLN
jgi:hypothetical protein